MKNVRAREFKDLTKKQKLEHWNQAIDSQVEAELDHLNFMLDAEEITEESYLQEIGCSKHYAETTSWFVPGVYYDNHRKAINVAVKETLNMMLYDDLGNSVVFCKNARK